MFGNGYPIYSHSDPVPIHLDTRLLIEALEGPTEQILVSGGGWATPVAAPRVSQLCPPPPGSKDCNIGGCLAALCQAGPPSPIPQQLHDDARYGCDVAQMWLGP